MNKKRAFYYVESAPQILSAYRHMMQYRISQYEMFVRLNGSFYNDLQIHNTLQDLGIGINCNVFISRVRILLVLNFIKISLFRKYYYFCIADVRSKLSLIGVVLCRYAKIILLDDGTASFDFYRMKSEGVKPKIENIFSKFFRILTSYKLKNITMYTLLPLETVNGIIVESCKYELDGINKGLVEINPKSVVFIGSKVVEAGVTSIEHFVTVMSRFCIEFSDCKLQYIAHREEDLGKLRLFPQIEIVRLLQPLEMEFGRNRPFPAVVCTFFSAGIIHFLPMSDRITLISYDIKTNYTNIKFHDSILRSRDLFTNLLKITVK